MRTRTAQAVSSLARLKGWVFAGAVASMVLGGAVEASAVGFIMKLEDITNPSTPTGVVIKDNGAGDGSLNLGEITFNGVINGFTVNVTTGLSKPSVPTASGILAELDLTSVNVHSAGAGKMRITLEDDGFTAGLGSPSLQFASSIGGTVSGGVKVSAQTWFDTTNAVPNLGVLTGTVGAVDPTGPVPATATAGFTPAFAFTPPNSLTNSYNANGALAFFSTTTYSMFNQVVLDFTDGGTSQFTVTAAVIPEPGTIVLLGVGLLGLMGAARRQRT